MADIELKTYIAEIEELLEAEKNDEAVAHCRHILDYYPRNLAVYRLLGKGLLELGRLEDASDIFYRVLSAAPDDFVAHVGMAIIGEEEGDLDKAIGHMERASEAQSNNTAIHSELKRLYGRRDGVEPAKIRLTRGALARLYLRGGNYSQAVDELQAALQSAPNRLDWQILLAQVLWKDEQRIDAVEACQNVLDKLPDCVQANSILYEIWHSAGREDEAAMFWGRVESLAPYLAHEIRDPSESSQPSFQIPRLDYVAPTPDEVMGVPDWVRDLGLGEDQMPSEAEDLDFSERMAAMDPEQSADLDDDAVLPDWLRDMTSTEEEASFFGPGSEGLENGEELAPDQAQDSRLDQSQEAKEPLILFEDAEESISGGDAQDEDLPEWLAEAVEWGDEQAGMITQDEEAVGGSDWLSEFSEESRGPTDSDKELETLPDWMQEIAQEDDSAAEDTLIAGRPIELPAASELSADLPDWLQTAQEEERFAEPDDSPAQVTPAGVPEPGGDLPDWLAVIQDDVPSDENASDAAPSEESGGLPDWLTAIQEEETSEPIDQDELTSDLGGEVVDQPPFDLTVEALAVPKEGEPFAISDEADLPSTQRDTEESVMVPSDKELGMPDDADDADDLESLLSDPDDALAWLEQLAAAEGTPLEELPSLQEEARSEPDQSEVSPDRMIEAADETLILSSEAIESPGIETLADLESASPEAIDELPDWLRELEAPPAEPPPPIAPGIVAEPDQTAIPDWLKDELGEGETAELGAELAALGADVSEMPSEPDEAAAWLEQLAAAQEDYAPIESGLGLDEPELPDWLAEAPADAAPEVEVSTILDGPSQPQAEAAAPDDDLTASGADEMGEMPEDLDEAMAWLEQLAAAEGAPLDELPSVTTAESAEPQLPSWLDAELHPDETETTLLSDESLAQLEQEAPEDEPSVVLDEPELPEWLQESFGTPDTVDETVVAKSTDLEEPELPEWLRVSVDEADVSAVEEPALSDEPQLPEWLREPEIVEEAGEAAVTELAALEEPELPEWLREPEIVEEAGEDAVTEPATLEEPELPDWLREPELVEETVEAGVTESTALEEPELPEWLREPDEAFEDLGEADVTEPTVALEEPDLPDWLHEQGQDGETVEAEPAVVLDEPELPEWLRESAVSAGEESEPVATEPAAAIEEPDLPEWLREPAEPLVEELGPQEVELVTPMVQEAEPAVELTEPEPLKAPEPAPSVETLEAPSDVFSLRHQVDAEPQDHVLRLALARVLRDDGMADEALTEYDELVSSGQELDDVAADLEQILDSNPGSSQTRRVLGDLYVKQNRLAEALDAYRKALGNL